MLFNSFPFILLVLVSFLAYYLPMLRKYQVHMLILSSFVFYAWHYPTLLILLMVSIGINITTSYLVANKQWKRGYATLGVIANLSILAFFKYSPLISVTFLSSKSDLGVFLLAIPLPVGISFFTFQGISLLVDTFTNNYDHLQEKIKDQTLLKHARKTALFIAFFPQLVAGPIVKAHQFYPQIKAKYFKDIEWGNAFQFIVTGYFLKMVIADNLKDFTFELAYPFFERFSTVELLMLLFGYSMQIFADFAGYSLIAIGISRLFGYKIPQNFNFPYVASSFSDFWRRWHISLSSFLKEYLYVPLGGNKSGKVRTYINLMIVMALGGLWHGAAWSYMVWGLFHGLALALERFFSNRSMGSNSTIYHWIKSIWVFVLVSFAWLLFKLPEFNHVIKYFHSLANNQNIYTDPLRVYYIFLFSLPVIIYHLHYLLKDQLAINFHRRLKPAMLGLMLFLIAFNSGSPQDFIYFQF